MPGASAIGYFANPPIRKLPIAAEIQVAAVTAASGIPASCKIAGFTKTIYAIVMKVVNPARISVRQVALSGLKSKYCSRRRRKAMGLHCSFEFDGKRQKLRVFSGRCGDLHNTERAAGEGTGVADWTQADATWGLRSLDGQNSRR